MDYEEYLKKVKSFMKKTALWQRFLAAAILVIALMIVVVLINPAKKLLEMRNSQRRSDVVNILNSVYQYSLDHDGQLPFSITPEPSMICKSKAQSCEGLVDMSEITGNKKYLLSTVPVDPKEKDANSSGYQISKLASGRISVSAPLAENNAVISLSK
jgi:hypothetical protein